MEFPCLLVESQNFEIVSIFHEYVKPVGHPILSEFCTQLTGITQEMVKDKQTFTEVFDKFQNWCLENNLNPQNSTFVTCDLWDLKTMLPEQCVYSKLSIPEFLDVGGSGHFVNLKYSFMHHTGKNTMGLRGMQNVLGLEFEGRHHSGIDDCRNILKVLIALAQDGLVLDNNAMSKPNLKSLK